MELSNYCQQHHKARIGKPGRKLAISLGKKSAAGKMSTSKSDGMLFMRTRAKTPVKKK
jgi:hypothetical protein